MFDRIKRAYQALRTPKVASAYGNHRLISGGNAGSGPFWPTHQAGIRKDVTVGEWKTIVSACNKLFWNCGILHGAIEDKANYAVGRAWNPRFEGEDKEWGKKAEAWLKDWYNVAYVNGNDFLTSLFLDSVALDRDGDTCTIYTETSEGFPQLQQIPWHGIGSRDGEALVKTGFYKGLRQYNGVILNPQGRAVAYRILGETPEDDRDISARSVDYLADAKTQDQTRGFPAFTSSINELRSLQTVQGYIEEAAKIAASIGLIESNDLGMADPAEPRTALGDDTPSTATGLYTQDYQGGTTRYFRANSGAKLEQLKNEIPSEATDRLMERLIRNALIGAGMVPEFAWKLDAGGASARMAVEKVNRTVADRQDVLRGVARRRVGYAVSKAIKLGILPPYKGSDIGGSLRWGFSVPKLLTCDAGYQGQDTREAYKLGLRNLTGILGEAGTGLIEHLDEREAEELAIRERMERSNLPESAFRLLTPNGNPPDQTQTPDALPTNN